MDIGTGKDLDEYILHGRRIPYHLIDLVPAGERYSLFAWQRAFHRAYEDLVGRGIRYPILCGGTGLYAEAVLRGYHLPDVPPNPSLREELRGETLDELRVRLSSYGPLHNTTDLDSAQRAIRSIEIAEYIREQKAAGIDHTEYPPIDSLILCLDLPREERRSRITLRLRERLEHQDMIGEVKELLASGIPAEDLIYYGLEYKFVTRYLLGELSYDEMFVSLETAIHQFAKRQITWFRGMERRGFTLHYIDALLPMQDKVEIALQLLHSWETDNQR